MPIERLEALPADYGALQAEAEAEGVRLLTVLAEDLAAGTMRLDEPGTALFAARDAYEVLRGVGALTPDPYAGEPGVGRVRRLYVAPVARRAGHGRALIEAMATAAVPGYRVLRVRAPPAAAAFYLACGFVRTTDSLSATHSRDLSA